MEGDVYYVVIPTKPRVRHLTERPLYSDQQYRQVACGRAFMFRYPNLTEENLLVCTDCQFALEDWDF